MLYFRLNEKIDRTTFSTNSNSNAILGFFHGIKRTTPTLTSGFGRKALPEKLILLINYKL